MSSTDGEVLLVAAVIRSGVAADGPRYLQGRCGVYWLGLGGLRPEAVWREYYRDQREVPPYRHAECECEREVVAKARGAPNRPRCQECNRAVNGDGDEVRAAIALSPDIGDEPKLELRRALRPQDTDQPHRLDARLWGWFAATRPGCACGGMGRE